MMNDNHSTGYSMIGYMCAYFRFYHPVEFICAFLNCANNADDIKNGTMLAMERGIEIMNIEFGKSGSEYTVGSNNSIYKGIASIKYCNGVIADELLAVHRNKNYRNFIELLDEIKKNTSVNSRQLGILIGLNFFHQFGKNKYLLDVVKVYDSLSGRSQFKKKDLEKLGLSDYLLKKYAAKETEKIYKDVDINGMVNELVKSIPNESMSIMEQVKFEKEYLEYVVYTNEKININYYIVIDFKTFSDPSKPYMTLHNLNTGEDIKTKVKRGQIYRNNPFGEYSILRVDKFSRYPKMSKVNGEWVKSDEYEDVLEKYEVMR